MRIINMKRGVGKTDILIKTAIATGYPIIVATVTEKNNIINLVNGFGFKNIPIFTINEWLMGISRGKYYENILIDNLDLMLPKILNDYFGCNVVSCTITQEIHNVRPKE